MDNPATQSTLVTRQRMKKTRETSSVTWTSQKKKMAWMWIHGLGKGEQFLFHQISSLVLKWLLWLYLDHIIVQLHMNCFVSTSYIIVSDIWFVKDLYTNILTSLKSSVCLTWVLFCLHKNYLFKLIDYYAVSIATKSHYLWKSKRCIQIYIVYIERL